MCTKCQYRITKSRHCIHVQAKQRTNHHNWPAYKWILSGATQQKHRPHANHVFPNENNGCAQDDIDFALSKHVYAIKAQSTKTWISPLKTKNGRRCWMCCYDIKMRFWTVKRFPLTYSCVARVYTASRQCGVNVRYACVCLCVYVVSHTQIRSESEHGNKDIQMWSFLCSGEKKVYLGKRKICEREWRNTCSIPTNQHNETGKKAIRLPFAVYSPFSSMLFYTYTSGYRRLHPNHLYTHKVYVCINILLIRSCKTASIAHIAIEPNQPSSAKKISVFCIQPAIVELQSNFLWLSRELFRFFTRLTLIFISSS